MHKFKYDPAVQAAYIKIRNGKVSKTVEQASGNILIDLDKRGRLLGIEILDLKIPIS